MNFKNQNKKFNFGQWYSLRFLSSAKAAIKSYSNDTLTMDFLEVGEQMPKNSKNNGSSRKLKSGLG